MKANVFKKVTIGFLVTAAILAIALNAGAGSLEPTSSPAPTMRTMDEIYTAASSSAGSYVTSGKEFAADDREIISMFIAAYPGSGFEGIEGLEDKSKILKVDHNIRIPLDPGTGQPAGARVHNSFRVVKTIDKASPGLHKACTTGEVLNEVIFDFYRLNSQTQQNEVYYKVTLRNAIVVDVGPSTDFVTPDSYRHMEQASFVYEEIEWSWLPDWIIETDRW